MICRGPVKPMAPCEGRYSNGSLWKSFGCAFEGVTHVVRTQRNFRIQLGIAGIALAAGIVLGLSSLELAVVGLAAAFVLFAEIVNTVVEVVVDLITLNYEPRAKVAKDVSAGAVVVAAITSVFVAVLVFVPHLINLFGGGA